jgi:ATP-dependent protease Clp ATPase subunit
MPKRSNVEPLRCSFCGKQSRVEKLLIGPNVYICFECATTFAHLPKDAALAEARSEGCSFCGKQAREVDIVLGSEQARICNECLDICQEIMADNLRAEKA